MKFKCHFLRQVQHFVTCGMIAGARNVVFFNTKCSWRARKVASAARRVAECWFHSRIMLGSFSDRSRIVNDVSAVLENFL